ncbi:MAG: DMSO reductase anchor subunit [Sulfurimonas sp.]|jgi:DMSO reductase anchor subunit
MKEQYTLIFLTLLVRLGLGTLVVYIIARSLFFNTSEVLVTFLALATTTSGLALSLFHLGKPGRILNSFSNLKSAMSWEAIIAPLALISIFSLVLVSYFYESSSWIVPLRMIVLIFSLAFIFVTGKVYHLRARPSWNTPLVVYEYFVSTIIFGIVGLTSIHYIVGNLTAELSKTIGFVLLVLLALEAIITYAFRARAIKATVTAEKALSSKKNKSLYTNFIIVGLIIPFAMAISLLMNTDYIMFAPAILVPFFIGAILWRIIFFRSATLIKITPDIKI